MQCFSCSIVVSLLDCSMWNALDSDVNFRFNLSFVCHKSPCSGPTRMTIFALKLRSVLRNDLRGGRGGEAAFSHRRNLSNSGTHHFFKTVGWYTVMKDDSTGSGLPECQLSFLVTAF